jgi:hypothetical protein
MDTKAGLVAPEVLLSASLAFVLACEPTHTACGELATTRAAVVGGVTDSPYVAFDWRGSVVPLVAQDGEVVCTAFAVEEQFLLSAAHCFPQAVAADIDGESFALRAALDPSDGADVLGVELVDAPPLRPLRLTVNVAALIGPGSLVEIVGFGVSEEPAGLTPRFAVLGVTEVLEDSIVTDGQRYAGACGGDSGSPILTRDADGAPVVVGILNEGSVTCRGQDRSLRADVARRLRADTGNLAAATVECGRITERGRCYDQRAVWCEAGALHGAACADGLRCGWGTSVEGYRCVAATDDPCDGISEFGGCFGEEARQCDGGSLLTSPCSACNAECVRSPYSGVSACASR